MSCCSNHDRQDDYHSGDKTPNWGSVFAMWHWPNTACQYECNDLPEAADSEENIQDHCPWRFERGKDLPDTSLLPGKVSQQDGCNRRSWLSREDRSSWQWVDQGIYGLFFLLRSITTFSCIFYCGEFLWKRRYIDLRLHYTINYSLDLTIYVSFVLAICPSTIITEDLNFAVKELWQMVGMNLLTSVAIVLKQNKLS